MSIHVSIHTLSDSIDVAADTSWTIFKLKQNIEEQKGVPWTEQRLLMGTQELDDAEHLDCVAQGCQELEMFLVRGMSEEKVNLLKLANNKPLNFLQDAPSWVYHDRQLMMIAVRFDVDVLGEISATLKADQEFILKALRFHTATAVLNYVPGLRNDSTFIFRAIEYDSFALRDASDIIKADGKILMKAGKRDWRAFQFAAAALKSDPKFAIAAVKVDWRAAKFFKTLLKDRSTALKLVRCNGRVLELLSYELQSDPEVALLAIEKDVSAFAHVAEALQSNQDFMLAATKIDTRVLANAKSPNIIKDRGFAQKVLEQVPLALEQLSCHKHFATDGELVMCAVQQNGTALKFASPDVQDDREVVLAAVRNSWRALQFASKRCRADKEIIGEATKQSSCACRFCLSVVEGPNNSATGEERR